jgi:hypothetical protein
LGGLHGQKLIWHAHDLSWHTPRHAMGSPWLAMAHTKACRGTHQGMSWPWHTPRHVMAAHGLPCHTPRHAMASLGTPWACRGTHQGMPWHPMGRPWHTPRHFLKKYLDFGRDILHTCLEKSYLQVCQVLRFLEKKKKKKYFFNWKNREIHKK